MAHDRLSVLLLAESCSPDETSVSLEGWSLAWALREHADIHVVTRPRNRDPILPRAGGSGASSP